MAENLKYVIIAKDEVSSVDFSKVLETSEDTLRWNKDKSKTIVKYIVGSKPSFLSGKTALSYSQILTETAKDEWDTYDPS